jgi:5-methylcytosine-specific restriction endonuclease McrA
MATQEDQREYQRRWRAQRRHEWIEANGPCAKCGGTEDLEVDHVDPASKAIPIAAIWSRSEAVRGDELAKCQVLCRSCHKAKTRAEKVATQHGTYAMRNQHGCECFECKEYVRRNKRESRARLKRVALSTPRR